MKKLLSFLGSLGLTAVGAAGVVSCGTSDNTLTPDKDGNITESWDVTAKDGKTLSGTDFDVTVKLNGTKNETIKPAITFALKKDGEKEAKNTFVLTATVNVKANEGKKAQKLEITIKSKDKSGNIASAFDKTITATIPAAENKTDDNKKPGDDTDKSGDDNQGEKDKEDPKAPDAGEGTNTPAEGE